MIFLLEVLSIRTGIQYAGQRVVQIIHPAMVRIHEIPRIAAFNSADCRGSVSTAIEKN